MRFIFFVLSIAVSSTAFSQTIEGLLERDSGGVPYLRADRRCDRYSIETKSNSAALSVRKLSTGDALTASGLLDPQTCTAVIETVDYVGLRKMLGYWYSEEGIISVKDFNSLSFYPIKFKDFRKESDLAAANPITYRYSVTPTEGKEWVLFLSDSTSTSFATIQFNKGNATMKIYDSENGDLTRVLRLSKWGNLQ